MAQPLTSPPGVHDRAACTPQARVTKSLLGYGVLAGPFYVVVSLSQALTREGFDLSRHQWSLLATGERGWVQVTNLVLTGLMVLAFSVGLRRASSAGTGAEGVGATWAPRLVAGYGVGLVASGLFRADPALGFPVGTPAEASAVSWHGLAHFASGGIGFTCLGAACFVLARRYAVRGRRGWAVASQVTGALFLVGFVLVASSGGSTVANLAFTAAVVLVWAWVAAVAVDTYREVAHSSAP